MASKTGLMVSIIQLFAMLTCIGALIAAAFTVMKIVELKNTDSHLLKDLRLPHLIDLTNPTIRKKVEASAAVAIVSGIVVPLGLIMVLIRPCGCEQYKLGRVVTALDFLLVLVATCGYGVAGVLGAITAKDWSEDIVSIFKSRDIVKAIQIDIAATAACSLLALGLCGVLLIFIVLHLSGSTRDRMTYTEIRSKKTNVVSKFE